ncbi:MAG: hypothetical protein IJP22_01965, partial [Clostridia bacterium]|nr:hypothetical protein [Clostridia bacterium]
MGIFEKIKNIWDIPEEEDYIEESVGEESEEPAKRKVVEAEPQKRNFGKASKTVPFNPTQM